jgi:hypothetical protein
MQPAIAVAVQNSSDLPVYSVEIRWRIGPALHGEPVSVGVLLPGGIVRHGMGYPDGTNIDVCSAAVSFTDAAGAAAGSLTA